jgi:mono/diheme cytochrome c family protein
MKIPTRFKMASLMGILAVASALWGAASSAKSDSPNATAVRSAAGADNMRIEGERRFQANCGRCHAAPHKFPPRIMATIVRHMRVRATITDEDMRLVLYYMTQ